MMWNSIGRPKSACTTCKGQKIRCSGERPICGRCSRLRRHCVYHNDPPTSRRSAFNSSSVHTNRNRPSAPRHKFNGEVVPPRHCTYSHPAAPLSVSPKQETYLGISESLMYTLVEVYYENAYNASLLLHKGLFLESLAAGTVEPHVILSICAWASK